MQSDPIQAHGSAQTSRRAQVARVLRPAVVLCLLAAAELALRNWWPDGRYFDNRQSSNVQGGLHIQLNGLGFRGPEPGPKHDGEFRIVAVGDSTTFGMSERADDAWPAQLGDLLKQRRFTEHVTVVNAAAVGQDVHETLRHWDRVETLEADVVIYLVTANDFVTDGTQTATAPQHDLRSSVSHLVFGGLAQLRVLSVMRTLAQSMSPRPASELITLSPNRFYGFGLGDENAVEQAWQATLMGYRELKARCDTDGVHLIVALLPYRFTISHDSQDDVHRFRTQPFRIDPGQRLGRFAQDQEIEFVDLTPAFAARRRSMLAGEQPYEPLFQPYDYVHPNPAGYRVVAETLLLMLARHVDPVVTGALRRRPKSAADQAL